MNDWINTYTGRKFHFLDPKPEDIDIEDIAAGLSNEPRYAGQTRCHYSVAAHSIIARAAVSLCGGTIDEQRWALLHDAAEAYVKDIPAPVLASGCAADLKSVERRIMSVISERFQLGPEEPQIVREVDVELLDVESASLLVRHQDWVVVRPARTEVRSTFARFVQGQYPSSVRRLFLQEAYLLGIR